MPQVEAVRAGAEVAQGGTAQAHADPRCGMRRGRDKHRHEQGQQQEPAAVQEGGVEGGTAEDEQHEQQRRRTGAVDDHARPRHQVGPHPARDPQRRQDGAGQQPHGVGVGSEVDPRRIVGGRVAVDDRQHEHQSGRQQRPDPRDPAHPGCSAHPPGQDQQPRPDEVELLLDRQRPQVLEHRRAAGRLEVALVGQDVDPVGDVGQRRGQVALLMGRLVRRDRDDQDRSNRSGRRTARAAAAAPAARRSASGPASPAGSRTPAASW